MPKEKLFISSHAPFWHNGTSVATKNYDIMLAALPAVVFGLVQYGISALAVLSLSISTAMIWELLINLARKSPFTVGDGNAALIGLLFGMLLPATAPWWLVVIGTFIAIVIGKQIFGGLGCNPFCPPLVALAIITLSWEGIINFNAALVDYDFIENMVYPLTAAKIILKAGSGLLEYSAPALFLGQQSGGIGATFGLGLVVGGVYLILRGHVRWEIVLSFLVGLFVTALIYHGVNPDKFAGPWIHLLAGYSLIGAFFLLPDDSSSPVNMAPMLIYGAGAGFLTILVRNNGVFVDGTVFAILLLNLASPLLDKIRPKAVGKGVEHA
jgi:electron transport complex protein RnfD